MSDSGTAWASTSGVDQPAVKMESEDILVKVEIQSPPSSPASPVEENDVFVNEMTGDGRPKSPECILGDITTQQTSNTPNNVVKVENGTCSVNSSGQPTRTPLFARRGILSPEGFERSLVEEELTDMSDISSEEFSDEEIQFDVTESSSDEERDDRDEDYVPNPKDWTKGPVRFQVFPFNVQTGLKVEIKELITPYDFFRLLFSNELIEMIVRETNRVAHQRTASEKCKSFASWKELDAEEFFAFLAVCLHMGVVNLPTLRDYWKQDILYKMNFFSRLMPRDRFLKILSCLRFADKSVSDKTDFLWKFKPLLSFFNSKMLEVNAPERELSIDKSMMLFSGRKGFRQYWHVDNKQSKQGIKFYMLCQLNGLVQKIILHAGRMQAKKETGFSQTMVYELLKDSLGKGHSIYMRSSYISVGLCKQLLKEKTHSTGTINKRSKGNCEEVIQTKLRKGDSIWRQNGGVLQLKWRDDRDVLMVSTEHMPDLHDTVNKRGELKQKPEIVIKYNEHMSSLNRADQMLSYYDLPGKQSMWYKRVAFHIFHLIVINASILYNANALTKVSGMKFHEEVVRGLITEGMHYTALRDDSQTKLGHFPQSFPHLVSGGRSRRRCRQCKVNKKCQLTYFYCAGCPSKPPLCVLCFASFKHEYNFAS